MYVALVRTDWYVASVTNVPGWVWVWSCAGSVVAAVPADTAYSRHKFSGNIPFFHAPGTFFFVFHCSGPHLSFFSLMPGKHVFSPLLYQRPFLAPVRMTYLPFSPSPLKGVGINFFRSPFPVGSDYRNNSELLPVVTVLRRAWLCRLPTRVCEAQAFCRRSLQCSSSGEGVLAEGPFLRRTDRLPEFLRFLPGLSDDLYLLFLIPLFLFLAFDYVYFIYQNFSSLSLSLLLLASFPRRIDDVRELCPGLPDALTEGEGCPSLDQSRSNKSQDVNFIFK